MLPLFLDTDQHGMCLAHFVEQPNEEEFLWRAADTKTLLN